MYWIFYTENTTISVKPPLTFVTESNQLRIWVGIQWRADDLIFDFETYPNYQKLSKFTNKSTTGAQNLRLQLSFARRCISTLAPGRELTQAFPHIFIHEVFTFHLVNVHLARHPFPTQWNHSDFDMHVQSRGGSL